MDPTDNKKNVGFKTGQQGMVRTKKIKNTQKTNR